MPKYQVKYRVVILITQEIEAKTPKKALEKVAEFIKQTIIKGADAPDHEEFKMLSGSLISVKDL